MPIDVTGPGRDVIRVSIFEDAEKDLFVVIHGSCVTHRLANGMYPTRCTCGAFRISERPWPDDPFPWAAARQAARRALAHATRRAVNNVLRFLLFAGAVLATAAIVRYLATRL